MPPPLLEIQNATVFRGNTRVLDKFSLRIPQQQNVAILGPNGAGKTTLLRLLTRELYPVVGAGSWVRVLGRERWNVRELRRHMGMVSHDLQVDYSGTVHGRHVVLSGFSASEGVAHVSYDFSSRERGATDVTMAELNISHLADKPYGEMSTGEQRRCLLARALVTQPQTLVLDEPIAGLDLQAAFAFLRTIQTLMERGVALVLVTHHVNEIPPAIERVVLLGNGEIIADGPKHDTLSEDNLTALYQTPIRLVESGGYFTALPAANESGHSD